MKKIYQAQHSYDRLTQVCISRLQSPDFARPPLGQQILRYIRTAAAKGGAL